MEKMRQRFVTENQPGNIEIPLHVSKLTLQFDHETSEHQSQESFLNMGEDSSIKRARYANDTFDPECRATFSKQYKTIYTFLESLPGPICLVTHAGFSYGFPILFGELKINNLLQRAFPPGVHFLDSMLAFISLEKSFNTTIERMIATKFGSENAPQQHPWEYRKAEGSCVASLRRFEPACFVKNVTEPWKFEKKLEELVYKKENLYQQIVGGSKFFNFAEDCAMAFLQTSLAYDKDFLQYLDKFAATFS